MGTNKGKGDTLVVAKPNRLGRSLRDAKDIVDELTVKSVKLSIGGSVHDTTDPVGRLLFNVARSTVYRTVQRQSVEHAVADRFEL